MSKTHVALILDQSGSMATTLNETITGFNEQLDALREMVSPDQEIGVTFTVFGTKVNIHYVDKPINEVVNLTEETYAPKGWTALYDAVGMTIIELEDRIQAAEDDAFLVMIFSDGEENQSKEYTSSTLASVVNRLKGLGNWTFTYLGSNQDLSVVVKTLGLDAGNVCDYKSDSVGTLEAYSAHAHATKKFLRHKASGGVSMACFYSEEGKITTAKDVLDQATK